MLHPRDAGIVPHTKSVIVIYHISELKRKKKTYDHLLNPKIAFDKNQHSFMISLRSEIPETYLNIKKAIYTKPIDNIKLNGERFKAAPLKSEIR